MFVNLSNQHKEISIYGIFLLIKNIHHYTLNTSLKYHILSNSKGNKLNILFLNLHKYHKNYHIKYIIFLYLKIIHHYNFHRYSLHYKAYIICILFCINKVYQCKLYIFYNYINHKLSWHLKNTRQCILNNYPQYHNLYDYNFFYIILNILSVNFCKCHIHQYHNLCNNNQ